VEAAVERQRVGQHLPGRLQLRRLLALLVQLLQRLVLSPEVGRAPQRRGLHAAEVGGHQVQAARVRERAAQLLPKLLLYERQLLRRHEEVVLPGGAASACEEQRGGGRGGSARRPRARPAPDKLAAAGRWPARSPMLNSMLG
jgi:hypothetical protein